VGVVINKYLGLIVGAYVISRNIMSWRQWGRWWKGKVGEKAVIEVLETLSDDYVLLNDLLLPARRGNVDHLVVGPNGIFVLETKNWSGKIKCIGDQWYHFGRNAGSPSKQAKSNALSVHNILSERLKHPIRIPFVVPVLTFVNRKGRLDLNDPTIPVVGVDSLAAFIREYQSRTVLSREDRREIIYCVFGSHAEPPLFIPK
jgi:hypothetical protein